MLRLWKGGQCAGTRWSTGHKCEQVNLSLMKLLCVTTDISCSSNKRPVAFLFNQPAAPLNDSMENYAEDTDDSDDSIEHSPKRMKHTGTTSCFDSQSTLPRSRDIVQYQSSFSFCHRLIAYFRSIFVQHTSWWWGNKAALAGGSCLRSKKKGNHVPTEQVRRALSLKSHLFFCRVLVTEGKPPENKEERKNYNTSGQAHEGEVCAITLIQWFTDSFCDLLSLTPILSHTTATAHRTLVTEIIRIITQVTSEAQAGVLASKQKMKGINRVTVVNLHSAEVEL